MAGPNHATRSPRARRIAERVDDSMPAATRAARVGHADRGTSAISESTEAMAVRTEQTDTGLARDRGVGGGYRVVRRVRERDTAIP
jgi:hypothetical protein